MHDTSELYRQLLVGTHRKETRLTVGDSGKLVDTSGNTILFGGTAILVDSGGPDSGYGGDLLMSVQTTPKMFPDNKPTIGVCASAEIQVTMTKPSGEILPSARLVPYVRLTDGKRYSEWIQKGVFYVDTIDESQSSSLKRITFHGYDSMLRMEEMYTSSNLDWPAKDVDVVREIATLSNIGVDSRTWDIMQGNYDIQYPAQYSRREVLGYIATMYVGCFIISDLGELLLVPINSMPPETRYLIAPTGDTILFGGDRILV